MKFKVEQNAAVVQGLSTTEELDLSSEIKDLDRAMEELSDFIALQENIETYGITEPVMDLIGGTLESMSIRTDDKDACLEGIGQAIATGAKAVFDFMRKIIRKIVEFITGFFNKRSAKEREELEKKLKETKKVPTEDDIPCTGLPEKKPMEQCLMVAHQSRTPSHNWTGANDRNVDAFLRYGSQVFYKTDSGSLEFLESFIKSMSEEDKRNYKEKKYSEFADISLTTGHANKGMLDIKHGLEAKEKEIESLEQKADSILFKKPETKENLADKRIVLVTLGKLTPILARIDRANLSYEKKMLDVRNKPTDQWRREHIERREKELDNK